MLDASCQMLGRLSLCEVSRMSVDNYTNAVKLEATSASTQSSLPGVSTQQEWHLLSLPPDVLGGVLGQLEDAADLAKLAQTCARMHALVTGTQWPQVRKLRLWRWTPSKPLASSWLSQRLTGLLELDVSGCHHLTDKDLACFSQLNLKILRLNGCRGLFHTNTPYKLIQAMSRNAEEQGLEVLDLCNTRCVADVRLSISLGPALRELYLSPTWKPQWQEEDFMAEVVHACPRLELLDISNVALTARMPVFYAVHTPTMQQLSLAGCNGTYRVCEMLAWRSCLMRVDLAGMDIINGELGTLARSCDVLQSLNISNCLKLTDAGVLSIALHSRALREGRLRCLSMQNLSITDDSMGLLLLAITHVFSPMGGDCAPTGLLSETAPDDSDELVKLDLTNCTCITNAALSGLGAAKPCSVATLRLSGCSQVTPLVLETLAQRGVLSQLSILEASHLIGWEDCVRAAPSARLEECSKALVSVISAASHRLRELCLDHMSVPGAVLAALGVAAPNLESLSIVGNRRLTDEGLGNSGRACSRLSSLVVGGPGAWGEGRGLLAISGLRHLTISRRSSTCTDESLMQVLQRHPQLRSLKLCSCAAVTDAALHALPGESMRQLQLLCCDGVQGWFLQGLPLLQLLHLSSCSAIDPGAIALATRKSCPYLRELTLPRHVLRSVVDKDACSCMLVEGGQREQGRRRTSATDTGAKAP